MYTGCICPCLEYCSHILGSYPNTSPLDRVESKVIHLIGDPSLTSTLDSPSFRRKVFLYTGCIRPCLEYCTHILGSSPRTSLLDRVESKAVRLIGDPFLTLTLDSPSFRCKVASLSLCYRYYFGHSSDELAACVPPPMAPPHSTQQASYAHSYCVELSNVKINRFSDGFFPSTSLLWSSLPSSVFPASFNLPSIKIQVYHHFRDQMALFIYLFFLTITLFKYFINLFYPFHCLFLFLRDADSRKGTLCPFCVLIHKKKKKNYTC